MQRSIITDITYPMRSRDVCPVELAGSLDTRIRRLVHNPRKILSAYVREGMTVLEVGCGPGFFTVELAHLVGETGTVIAADLQVGMLGKVRAKLEGTPLAPRVRLHTCSAESIGVTDAVDFVLLFYMVHEVPDQAELFREVAAILKTGARVLLVEPPFHVSKSGFAETLRLAGVAGLAVEQRPGMGLDKAAVLRRLPVNT